MTPQELHTRIRRVYAAIDPLHDFDIGKLPAKVVQNERGIGMFQDFSGGLTKEDIENLAYAVVHNIANLQDHLRRWAANNGMDEKKVDATVNGSLPLQLIKDLSNNDKHGYPPRRGGRSGAAPQLVNLGRRMRLTPGPEAGSKIMMTFAPDGTPRISGSGVAYAVLTGDVVDRDGEPMGDLWEIEQNAVKAWEALLADFGIAVE
jgi:hypothetical protein